MKNKINIIIFFLCALFFISCASVPSQPPGQTADNQEFFLEEDDEEINEELQADLEVQDNEIEDPKELQERQAEGELEEIEDEFAEFIEDEEEQIEEIPESAPEEQEIALNDTEEQQADDSEEEWEEFNEEEEQAVQGEDPSSEPVEGEQQIADADQPVSEDETGALDEGPIAQEEQLEEYEEAGLEESSETVAEETASGDTGGGSLRQITNIRYQSNNIYIDTLGGSLSYRSRFNEATKQLVIEIPSAVLVDQLKWPYIMKEFQSHFALLQADQKTEDTVRIIVQMRPLASAPSIIQKESGDGLIVSSSVQDLTDSTVLTADQDIMEEEEEQPFSEEQPSVEDQSEQILGAKTIDEFLLGTHKFYGHPITLDVKDANVRDIIYFLAEDTGINMIVSNGISPAEKISISLKEVPWDQALVLIMKHKKLGYIRRGNVVIISTLGEIQEERKFLEQILANRDKYAKLYLEIIPIEYAKASAISSQIEIFKTKNNDKVFINVDSNNNFLIIRETEEAMVKMKKLIKELDRTPKQVMIAAKVVEVNENFEKNFGVSWRLTGTPFSLGGFGQSINITPSPLFSLLPDPPDSGTVGSNFRVGTLPVVGDLDAFLGLAETEQQVRVLSSPRIVALNGQSASVNQSSESIGFSAVSTQSGSQTQIQKSTLTTSLTVTPNITNVNSIYMTVNMTRSFPGARVGQGESSAEPTFTRAATTEILVNNGQTAVIGGVYESINRESLLGLPILKYIPFVKWLFSKTNTSEAKTELLLFLTPSIISLDQERRESAAKEASQKSFSKSS